MNKNSDTSIITPHAAFLIWNYYDRMGSRKVKKVKKVKKGLSISDSEVDQLVISTMSLKSMSTNKSKTAPNGTFEVKLAPTKNWVQVITPGSWCAILISRDALTREDIDSDNALAKAHPHKIKLLGRVNSVRVTVGVNQQTGARVTEYIVTGVDWGSIFNTTLLVDPAMAADAKNNDTPIGYITQLIYNKLNEAQNTAGAVSTKKNIRTLLSMWGSKLEIGKVILNPEVRFSMPEPVAKFFGFKTEEGSYSNIISDLVHIYDGNLKTLNNNDEYNDSYDNTEDSFGIVQGEDILGQNNMWATINALSNTSINEVVCDLRWEGDNPILALYKRIKPFVVDKDRMVVDNVQVGDNKGALESKISDYTSEFKNIRRVFVPLNEIISFNAGNNWADKINFIEVKPSDPSMTENIASHVRFNLQFYDKSSFAREGLRSFVAKPRYYPKEVILATSSEVKKSNNNNVSEDDEIIKDISRDKNNDKQIVSKDLEGIIQWKYLLKEWYFDVHKMLNGAITFFCQDKYIQVGDNIIVDAKILGYAENTTSDQINNRGDAFLLMHVESISHQFTVGSNGTRHAVTNVNFVRGIIVRRDGSAFFGNVDAGQLDQDVREIRLNEEVNRHNVWTKTEEDPD